MFGLSHRTAQTLTVDRKGAAEAALYGHAGSGVDGGGGGPRSGCAWQGRIAALYGSESSSVLSDISRDYVFFLSSIQSIITVPRLKKKKGKPLQYSCLENPMDRGDWWAIVHGVTKSQTRLSSSDDV